MHSTTFALLLAMLACATGLAQAPKSTVGITPPITIATDGSWEVSARPTLLGEYPLSAEQVASATSPLYGGTLQAVAAEYNPLSKIIPGSVPIWRNRTANEDGEAYQFRKNIALGAAPIRKATLEVNCDDVARVYINKRLASADKRDGTLKDGYDDWFNFRSVSGFTYNRTYVYDVTDYFFTNVTNTIFVEAVSLAFDGSHAYFSAKIVIEFAPAPEKTLLPQPKKHQPAAAPKARTPPPPAPGPEKIVFEADRDPGVEQLQVGSILELGHVYFAVNDYQLDTASYPTLIALTALMQRHPDLRIEVGGHTNLHPKDDFADRLSTNRARTVARYLIDHGVAANRITYKGYGKSRPRVNGMSKAADRANQRVEVKII